MADTRELDPLVEEGIQYSHDYFNYFHRRRLPYPGYQQRRDVFRTYPVPAYETPRADLALVPGDPSAPPQVLPRRAAFHIDGRTDDGEGRYVSKGMKRYLKRSGLIAGRVLGAGSQGLAVEVTHKGKKMVAKWSLELEPMVVEMWAMKKLSGAKHIVQNKRIWVPKLTDGGISKLPEDVMDAVVAGEDDYTQDLGTLLDIEPGEEEIIYTMEYMKHGNFNGLLRKMSKQEAWVKTAEIWRVFYCLFRACVGLAYPGHWDRGQDGQGPENCDTTPLEEFIPMGPHGIASTSQGIIDFDMNDRNVMIGDYDLDNTGFQHAHDQVPVFKVGDFGHIRAYRTDKYRNSMQAIVAGRVCGNPWCNTPEQFTKVWKNYAFIEDLQKDETAGQYDWWTNLWQVARLMQIMITQMKPDAPPVCAQVGIRKPNGQIDQVFTYGTELLGDEYDHYDLELRNTVVWCMAHRPRDRPTMVELAHILREAVNRNDWPGDDEPWDFRTTIAELLGSAPPQGVLTSAMGELSLAT